MISIFPKSIHRIGIALSGGGARGFAHAGALLALEQAGIHPDIIAGVSAGSIVAAMYASGMHPRDMLESFDNAHFNDFTELKIPGDGLLSLDPFRRFLSETIPVKRLEDMRIPTVVGVTNFETGLPEAFRSGSVAEMVAASCSIPIVFKPAEINGVKYVDGGLTHNLPAWAIRKECKTLIGINCSPLQPHHIAPSGIIDSAIRSFVIVAKSNALPDLEICDSVISLDDVADYQVFDLKHNEKIFSAGYEAALKAIQSSNLKL